MTAKEYYKIIYDSEPKKWILKLMNEFAKQKCEEQIDKCVSICEANMLSEAADIVNGTPNCVNEED